jgi:hypothetical protein
MRAAHRDAAITVDDRYDEQRRLRGRLRERAMQGRRSRRVVTHASASGEEEDGEEKRPD